MVLRLALASALLVLPKMAVAYVGPGAAVSLFGALIGLVVAVGAAFGILLLWPLRRVWKKRKPVQTAENAPDATLATNAKVRDTKT